MKFPFLDRCSWPPVSKSSSLNCIEREEALLIVGREEAALGQGSPSALLFGLDVHLTELSPNLAHTSVPNCLLALPACFEESTVPFLHWQLSFTAQTCRETKCKGESAMSPRKIFPTVALRGAEKWSRDTTRCSTHKVPEGETAQTNVAFTSIDVLCLSHLGFSIDGLFQNGSWCSVRKMLAFTA